MHETLETINQNVILGLGELAEFFGFGTVTGQLYGALLMSKMPLSLDDLEEIVVKSKASVSMHMRNLERWRMVRQAWVKGDRRKYYEAETDLWKIVTYVLQSRELNDVKSAVKILETDIADLESVQSQLNEEEHELADFYQERVADLYSFFRFAQLLLENIVASEEPPEMDSPTQIEIT